MPHVIIEFPYELASDEQAESLLEQLHHTVVASGLFEEGNIRLRTQPFIHYRLGGALEPYIHVQLRIHSGRTSEQKGDLSRRVLDAVRQQGWPVKTITVEVVEMVRDSYAKFSADPATCG